MSAFRDAQRVELEIPLPKSVYEITQRYERTTITDVYQAVKAELLNANFVRAFPARSKIAVAVGSRGIANLPQIVKAVVDTFRELGCEPFVTPAMGSHGGGTAEGQIEVLASLGVTEASVGASVQATMKVHEVGRVPGGPVFYQDTLSAAADFTFLISRVKPHTDFHGTLESGLTKMAVIGLGKKIGATEMHEFGAAGFRRYLVDAARIYEARSNLIGGLGIVENGYDETAVLKAVSVAEIGGDSEIDLLNLARQKMGSLAFENIDVLVVRELGKNISGTGLDTNIIERLLVPREQEAPGKANLATIAVLRLTHETHGNASGIGLANVTTLHAYEQIDWHATYTNALTSGIFGMQRVSLPMVMPDDRMAIQAAVRGCAKRPAEARILFIENTLRTDRMWISPTLKADAEQHPRVTVEGELPLGFTAKGKLASPWALD